MTLPWPRPIPPDAWRETPPPYARMAEATIRKGDAVAQARYGGWVTTQEDFRDRDYPLDFLTKPTWTLGPRRTSLWIAGARDLIATLPRENPNLTPCPGDGERVTIENPERVVLDAELLLADHREVEGGLFPQHVCRMVWLIGTWTLTAPTELVQRWQGATVDA